MFKNAVISTIFAISTFQASADPSSVFDLSVLPADVAARVAQLQQYGDQFEPAIVAILAEHAKPAHSGSAHEYDLSILPVAVAAQVVILQQYGDRFEPAIRAIFAEHVKPSSGFDGCVQESVDDSSDLVQG